MVAGDADRQAIRAVAEDGDETLSSRGISSTQRFQESPVLINSRRADAWMLPTPSEGADMPSIAIQCSGRLAPSYIMLAVIYTSSVRVVSRSKAVHELSQAAGSRGSPDQCRLTARSR